MSHAYEPFLAQARALQAEAKVIDLHVDSLIQNHLFGYDLSKRHRAGIRGQPFVWHADIPRMTDASYGGAAMGVHYWQRESANGVRTCHAQIDALDRFASEDPRCLRVRTPDEWAKAIDEGLLGMAPGVEGAHMLNQDIENLVTLCQRGLAYLTLAHFSKNAAATPGLGKGANEDDTLTPFGEEVVQTLNRYGRVVDVAHLNMPCAIRAAELSDAPVFATHSGAKGAFDHARLLSDAAIDAIAAKDGAIGVIYGPGFLAGKLRHDSTCVVDHIDYIAKRVGIRHVATGSDYDGWLYAIPSDHRDCRDSVKITAELLRRGYTEDEVRGVLSGNARRVFESAWAARAERV